MVDVSAAIRILGLDESVCITPEEMAKKVKITFAPQRDSATINVSSFITRLEKIFLEIGVEIIPYADAFERRSMSSNLIRFFKILMNNIAYQISHIFSKNTRHEYIQLRLFKVFIKSKRFKKGVSIITTSQDKEGSLPMEYIRSFKDNSVITILDFPNHINENSDFTTHFDTAMNLFAYHMTNIVIAVDAKRWMLYNFNASHPIYYFDKEFKKNILLGLIPKIAAPICPNKLSEFRFLEKGFNVNDDYHLDAVLDIVKSARDFDKTGLYPTGKKINELPFRNSFHRYIGKMHLDNRSGMSYGFIAKQMPVILSKLINYDDFAKNNNLVGLINDTFFKIDGENYIKFKLLSSFYVMKIPEIWVLSQRSGSDKVNVVPENDLLKLGMVNGVMYMQLPEGTKLNTDYKPSFDTRLILAHALGNAIVGSILKHLNSGNVFSSTLENKGVGIAHWHGYFNPNNIPSGHGVYGFKNPHVSCSSPQSAIYALLGKLSLLQSAIGSDFVYKGDIHVEPHHGSNITFLSLGELVRYILNNPKSTVLGNKYLYLYKDIGDKIDKK